MSELQDYLLNKAMSIVIGAGYVILSEAEHDRLQAAEVELVGLRRLLADVPPGWMP